MRKILLLCLTFALLHASERAEFYMYWNSDLRGRQTFSEVGRIEDSSLHVLLDHALKEKGIETHFMDIDAYKDRFQKPNVWTRFKRWIRLEKPPEELIEDVKYYIFWGVGKTLKEFDFSALPKDKLVLFLWEPPTVDEMTYDLAFLEQFHKVFTWKDDLIDGKRFIKFHYPSYQNRDSLIPFSEKKFCTMINSFLSSGYKDELYSEREKVIEFFEDKEGEFDLYGRYWEKRKYQNYRGFVQNKLEMLKNYKFCICYENTKNIQGYITEKIFDCFAAGTIPIYFGAENIERYIPKECFIDRRDFSSFEEVYLAMKTMDEKAYHKYLKAAEKFLQSDRAKHFKKETFYSLIKNSL